MLLRKITLEDFGAYRGKQSLDLATRPDRPIILIGGLNGCGKTTLLDAIQLALYGPRARCSGRGNRSYETYLRESINRQADPSKGARIFLEFSTTVDGEERIYGLFRRWYATGKTIREIVTILVNGEPDTVLGQTWADHVEDLLPHEVASLFFFDGEKIESLADTDRAAPVVESAVNSLLGVNTIAQLRTDLLALQRRQKLSEEDEVALAQIEAFENQLREIDEAIADAAQRAASVRSNLDRAEEHRVQADAAYAKEGGELYRRRAELEAERQQTKEQLNLTNKALSDHAAAGPLPLSLLSVRLEAIREQTAREQTADEAAQVLDVLHDRDRKLFDILHEKMSAEDLAAIAHHLEQDRASRAAEAAFPRVFSLSRDAVRQLDSLGQVLDQEKTRAQDLRKQAGQYVERLQTLDRLLAGVPDEGVIRALAAERDRTTARVTEFRVELRTVEEAQSVLRRQREQLVATLERIHRDRVSSLENLEHATRVIAYADRMRATLEKFGDALLKRHISKLEVAVLDSFTRLMRKNGLVRDLRIDTDKFTLTLVGPDGDELDPSRLSAGERQLLAVSLLWGLARVAGNHLPSVIDTPLGRLDSRHREHLVERYFPHASHQVLLLSTDEEIDEYLLSRLRPSVTRSYTLIHDDATFTTTVEPGYWWSQGATHVA